MKRPIAIFALFLALGGCSRSERSLPSQATLPDDASPQDGGTLVRRLESDVATVNPILATSRYDRFVDNYLFTPLVALDQNLRPAPGLAESWEISPDGRVYTFHLDPKATFSDGTHVLASDLLFTMRKIADPQTGAAQVGAGFELFDAAASRILDPHTAVIAFKEPLASQLVRFNDVLVVPEHVYGKGDFKNDFNNRAVGSGPYRLTSLEAGRQVVLDRRSDYQGTRPLIQRVVFKTIVDANTAWNAIRHGDIDETQISSDVWLHESRRPEMLRQLDFRRFYTLNYNFIAWNETDPQFADKRVRRALGMCVDLPSIITNLYHGTARAMNGPFTPDQYAYNPTVPVLPFDPAKARQLLNDAGWFDSNHDGMLDRAGKPFKFELYIFAGSATGLPFAQLLQEELKRIGVEMTITQLDPALMLDRVLAGNFQSAYMSWDLDPEPDVYQILHSSQFPPRGQNFVHYANPAADALIDSARHQVDYSKRQKLYQQLHLVLADDQPYTWTIQVSEKWALSRNVRNVKESRGFGLFTWYPGELDWWLARDQRRSEVPTPAPAPAKAAAPQ